MKNTIIFVTGIGTDVGKTLCSAILVEALQADYFKPVQAGDLSHSDTHKVQAWVSNEKSRFFPNAYALKQPMSPHAAADIDGVQIDIDKIQLPETDNILVVEGAGGLFVPLNKKQTIFDLIKKDYKVVVVSRHYLGSINHSLLTLKALETTGAAVSLIFNGPAIPSTESIIQEMQPVPLIGRIEEEETINKAVVKKYADAFRAKLMQVFELEQEI